MSDFSFKKHVQRISAATTAKYGLGSISNYIRDNIRLDGKPYSFKGFEFQEQILNDTSPISLTVKVAQIGLSTLSYAHALAACAVQPHFGYGYVFPHANDAIKACATRINPMVEDSPEIKRLVNPDLDNTELKQIGSSLLYFRGCSGSTAALSISLDFLTIDEYDRCDPLKAAQYVSRLQGKNTKMQRIFSTPTAEGVGITRLAETAKRYRQFAKCVHCNHQWLPSYHEDVKVPEFMHELKEITRVNIKNIRWREATWTCPRCGKDPQFHFSRLEWVCENQHENYEANCWYISPVTGYSTLLPSYLVNISTQFGTYHEFQNQALGEAVQTTQDNLSIADIRRNTIQGDFSESCIHYFGADMGVTCHITIAKEHGLKLIVVHREKVDFTKFEVRRRELMSQYRCVISVHDMQPYIDLINRITMVDPNAHGAVFTVSRTTEMYRLVEKEEDKEEGKLNVRRLNVGRTAALDHVMSEIKLGNIIWQKMSDDFEEEYLTQMTDLKRVQVNDKSGDMTFQWQKNKGNDHFHFSLLYCYLAWMLRATMSGAGIAGRVPMMKVFKLTSRYEVR